VGMKLGKESNVEKKRFKGEERRGEKEGGEE
jgi:hypothetical protein